ncbi:IniB N-terminal domain-containing protein [Micromonospora phytophila]|uniref:IniB N-terminal domain-containing protein n=1 Tax=Micromonospora phytophila TaxID=709888 RepID=UPI002030A37D|nr:IniB N-terminal domain-containing protein [Micromonospora phytophila]MCM0677384.1 IniB N-terminal domain-containing protein [Micromonospora phytophila]
MDQTLHDFVLNLLTDPDARSAFDLDPEGSLRAAGLTDLTATDVQDVVPLVVDYAPVNGLAPVAPVTGELGADPLLTDTTDVVGQLQGVAQQITLSSSYNAVDLKAGVLGAIAVDPSAVAAGATVLPGIGLGVDPTGLYTDFTGVHDVAHTLDADVVGAVDTAADPAVGDVAGTVGHPDSVLDATDSGLLGTPDGLLGGPLAGTHGQLEGVVGSLGVDDTLGGLGLGDGTGVVPPVDVPSTVGGVTGQVDGVLSGVDGTVGSVTGGVSADAGVHGEASASTGGVLGLGDGLF